MSYYIYSCGSLTFGCIDPTKYTCLSTCSALPCPEPSLDKALSKYLFYVAKTPNSQLPFIIMDEIAAKRRRNKKKKKNLRYLNKAPRAPHMRIKPRFHLKILRLLLKIPVQPTELTNPRIYEIRAKVRLV